jgi:hypothetical protein
MYFGHAILYVEAVGKPARAYIFVGAHGFGVVMCVARHDFVVNRPQGEEMANERGVLYLYIVKLKRVVAVVRGRMFAWRQLTGRSCMDAHGSTHIIEGGPEGSDGNGLSAAIGKSGRWRAEAQLVMW